MRFSVWHSWERPASSSERALTSMPELAIISLQVALGNSTRLVVDDCDWSDTHGKRAGRYAPKLISVSKKMEWSSGDSGNFLVLCTLNIECDDGLLLGEGENARAAAVLHRHSARTEIIFECSPELTSDRPRSEEPSKPREGDALFASPRWPGYSSYSRVHRCWVLVLVESININIVPILFYYN